MFVFGEKQRAAFGDLKRLLMSEPVLKIYTPEAESELHTDACKQGYGAILLQKDSVDSKLHPVYYYSRKTTDQESRYCSYELEVLAIVRALEKFRVYLLGINFKIVTDCAAFKQTMAKKVIAARIAGWALQLEEYRYTLEHRKGTHMKHVDALSRNPIILVITSELLERIRCAQEKDEKLKVIKSLLNHGPYEKFIMKQEIVYKENDLGEQLLCIPKTMEVEIIKSAHSEGHFGVKKMIELIERKYYIPKLREKCGRFRSNCISCILGDRKQGKQEGFLNPLPKGEFPLSVIHLDHLGPLVSTKKNYKYILTMVDGFSKFLWIYPTKTTTTTEVLAKMKIHQSVFGNPEYVITDRGTAFTSKQFEEYCVENKIKHTLITTGVPRGNGQVERMNGVIVPLLTKLSRECPEKWYKYTENLQRFVNSTWQRSIKHSPFEVMFGVQMRNQEDVGIAEAVTDEIINAFFDERNEMRSNVRNDIVMAQHEHRRTYNKKRKPAIRYNVNDVVAIKRTQFGSGLKISAKFLGPYRITEVLDNDRYKVVKVGEHEGPMYTSTAADFMKPWSCSQYDIYSSDEYEKDENTETADTN